MQLRRNTQQFLQMATKDQHSRWKITFYCLIVLATISSQFCTLYLTRRSLTFNIVSNERSTDITSGIKAFLIKFII